MKNILVVVCHPDDEAFWVGGIISELSRIPSFRIWVVCLSGRDSKSKRSAEFKKAQVVSGYHAGIVLGSPLKPASVPLPKTSQTLEKGLVKLKLNPGQIDLLITHSPFGDEHMHPHHKQAYRELFRWAKSKRVPFGFFSCIPIPYYDLRPVLHQFKKLNSLHLVNFSRCRRNNPLFILLKYIHPYFHTPKFFLQFATKKSYKDKMINCYRSVNLKLSREGYASVTCNVENLYIFDNQGIAPILKLIKDMPAPGSQNLFSPARTVLELIWSKINKYN